MKKIVSAFLIVCFILVPVISFADETDYSYLENMTVKELKDLRNAIDELLGEAAADEETASYDIENITEEERFAADAIMLFMEGLEKPESLEINTIYVSIEEMKGNKLYSICMEATVNDKYDMPDTDLYRFMLMVDNGKNYEDEMESVKERFPDSSPFLTASSVPAKGDYKELNPDKILQIIKAKQQ